MNTMWTGGMATHYSMFPTLSGSHPYRWPRSSRQQLMVVL